MALISFSKIKLSFAALTRAPALEFKQRIHRRIAVDPFDGFAQKGCHRQRDNFHAVNRRTLNRVRGDQFVNRRFSLVVQLLCYLVGVVLSYLIYRFALSTFILPKISSANV